MVPLKQADRDYSSHLSDIFGLSIDEIKTITFQITDACSLACSYCYQINKGTRVMSFETAKKFVDLMFSGEKGFKEYLGDPKALIIEFIGGEPTLQPKLMDQIFSYIKLKAIQEDKPFKDKIRCSLSSNGMHYFEPEVQAFLNKFPLDISLGISIDGDKELHDSCRRFPDGRPSYDKAVAAMQDWVSRGNSMESKLTLSPDNIKYFSKAIKNMIALNYKDIFANCVFEEGWQKSHATVLYNELKEIADYMLTLEHPEEIYFRMWSNEGHEYNSLPLEEDDNWCGGDGKMIAIDPEGRLFPCIRYMESSLGNSQPPICIGDVDNGIGHCASCQKCLNMLKGITRSSQSTEECMNCPVAGGCAWCSGYNYQRFGTLNHRATFICWMHKAASLANTYYINNLNKRYGDKDRIPVNLPKQDAIQVINEDEYEMLVKLSKER